jgi:hypothetical protein
VALIQARNCNFALYWYIVLTILCKLLVHLLYYRYSQFCFGYACMVINRRCPESRKTTSSMM